MSKARGIQTIKGKEPVLKTAICAVEYDSGELYFDRVGRVIRQLDKGNRGWLRSAAVGTNQTQILNPTDGIILNVTPLATSLTLSTEGHPEGIEPENIASFAEQAMCDRCGCR